MAQPTNMFGKSKAATQVAPAASNVDARPKKKIFTVSLNNKPGELSKTTKILAEAGVNIEAIEAEVLGQHGFLRFYASNSSTADEVLRRAGYIVTTVPVLEVVLPNHPGEIARMADTLAKGKVNIESSFGAQITTKCRIEVVLFVHRRFAS